MLCAVPAAWGSLRNCQSDQEKMVNAKKQISRIAAMSVMLVALLGGSVAGCMSTAVVDDLIHLGGNAAKVCATSEAWCPKGDS